MVKKEVMESSKVPVSETSKDRNQEGELAFPSKIINLPMTEKCGISSLFRQEQIMLIFKFLCGI